jgi:TonB family protein
VIRPEQTSSRRKRVRCQLQSQRSAKAMFFLLATTFALLAQQPPPPPPPPPIKTAASPPPRVRIAWSVYLTGLRRWVAPEPQRDARQGVVRLRIVVGTDGNTRSAEFLSGDRALAESARGAVLQWAFQRTGLSTDWAEVETVVDVHFPPRLPCLAP